MTKEQENKYLEQMPSNAFEALKQKFDGLIRRLTDSRTFKTDDFEMEGKSSLKAAAILQKIVRDLEILKKEKPEIKKPRYD